MCPSPDQKAFPFDEGVPTEAASIALDQLAAVGLHLFMYDGMC